jgi:tRNA dimethylallyltransferase
MKKKRVIVIVGPTASGKTALSIELARRYNTAIISADSRQCYKELNIGVAKPPAEALQSIQHYFISSHSVHDEVNAEVFEQYALNAAKEIFDWNDTAIMVGGTGMYIKAFCEGLDEIPSVDTAIRNEIIESYKQNGITWLRDEIKKKDPVFWQQAEQQNPRRLMRALEVIHSTGRSIVHFRTSQKKERSFRIIKLGIFLPRQQLHYNIDNRVNKMIADGLVDEVRSLSPYKNLNALQTVGYREVFGYIDNKLSLDEAVLQIKHNTKQYAKRQLTWFKKDASIHWLNM